jgi:hypothetical protein
VIHITPQGEGKHRPPKHSGLIKVTGRARTADASAKRKRPRLRLESWGAIETVLPRKLLNSNLGSALKFVNSSCVPRGGAEGLPTRRCDSHHGSSKDSRAEYCKPSLEKWATSPTRRVTLKARSVGIECRVLLTPRPCCVRLPVVAVYALPRSETCEPDRIQPQLGQR